MSEAGLRPIGAYPPAWKLYGLEAAPVGSHMSGDERTDRIDLLAARVAEVVKAEVNRFFEWEAE
jgi:hypothetical protein